MAKNRGYQEEFFSRSGARNPHAGESLDHYMGYLERHLPSYMNRKLTASEMSNFRQSLLGSWYDLSEPSVTQKPAPATAPGGSPASIDANQYLAPIPDLSSIQRPDPSSLVTYQPGGELATYGPSTPLQTYSAGAPLQTYGPGSALQTYQGVGALPTYQGVGSLPAWMAGNWQGSPEWQGFGADDLELDPGYQFRLSEGEKAIRRRSAAAGMTGSGATGKALTQYGQELASQEFAAARGRAVQDHAIRQEQQRYDYEIRERDRARAHDYLIQAKTFEANEARAVYQSLLASKQFEADEARAIVNSINQAIMYKDESSRRMIDSINQAAMYGNAQAMAVVDSINQAAMYRDSQARSAIDSQNQQRMYADQQRFATVESQNQGIRYRDEQAWRSFDTQLNTMLGQYNLDQGAKNLEYEMHRQVVEDGKEMMSALALIQGQTLSAQIQALLSAFEAMGAGELGSAYAQIG